MTTASLPIIDPPPCRHPGCIAARCCVAYQAAREWAFFIQGYDLSDWRAEILALAARFFCPAT